jgi:hypothetical protein
VKRLVKSLILSKEVKLRRIRGGIASGRLMSINLWTQLQRYLGLDEREIAPIVRRLSSRCRTLVDVGANDGYCTVFFLNSGADCVVACEPGPVNKELLSNAAANGHQLSNRFLLEQRLVGSAVGEATLREILDEYPRPVFVKVDVDGGELGVLQSAENYSFLNDVSWVVETHSAELEQACIDWFCAHGCEAHIISPAWWRRLIPEQRPLEHNRWLVARPSK